MRRFAIFLDDGGVMNDNAPRSAQWERLVAEFFAPRHGGAPDAWGEANRAVATALFADYERMMVECPDLDFNAWLHDYRLAWVRGMCERVGVAVPADNECLDLYAGASAYVTVRVRASFPGVAEAIVALHAAGHAVHTASGEESSDLDGYLTGMGVRHCFGARLYGPDLINVPKAGPLYYERIFADAGVDPRDALVVDDFPGALAWARAAGARTAWVRSDRGEALDADFALDGLRDLPAALERLLDPSRRSAAGGAA